MSGNKKLVLLRLQKQYRRIKQQPIEQAWVARQGLLNFHFCIHSLGDPYQGGYYHGVLQLSQDYPFSPPKLKFFTPSGRFEVSKPICTSFTNFHKETWSSAWNIRTMITATISFMTSDEHGAGGEVTTAYTKRKYAKNSLAHNLKSPSFQQLFRKEIKQERYKIKQNPSQTNDDNDDKKSEKIKKISDSAKLYGLYTFLGIILLFWLIYRT